MEYIKGWWFTTTDRKLPHGDNRQIRIGRTHKVKGEITPCKRGLHLSRKLLDALKYAPGPVVYKVQGSGTIISHGNPIDKYVCSERTYLAGGVDATEVLRKFARLCALDVVHLWDAPDVVIEYLKTGKEDLMSEASAVASAAASASASATASAAAWSAANAAAWSEASTAANNAAWSEASAEARKKQNRRLTRMVKRAF